MSKQGTIGNSSRARKGTLAVVEKHCPKCGHHKALSTATKLKCSKCGYRHGEDK